ncbi:MAG: hypothetical protein AAGD25_16325 [Cyanobacteria bacterium P01_F01_bin.150]
MRSSKRKIVVDGVHYEWLIRNNRLHYANSRITIYRADINGATLYFDPYPWLTKIRPQIIADAIRFAIANGWQPNAKGPVMSLRYCEDSFLIEGSADKPQHHYDPKVTYINLGKPIDLCPVIEIQPYQWSTRSPPSVVGAKDHPAEWSAYFLACMADLGIEELAPIADGSMFVNAFNVVKSPLMPRLLKRELSETGIPGYPDDEGREDRHLDHSDLIAGLTGGYAVISGDRVLLEPQCCCDFSNLNSWKILIQDKPTVSTIWIGHPEPTVMCHGQQFTIREGWESSSRPTRHIIAFTVSETTLRQAVLQAEQKADELYTELVKTLLQHQLVPHNLAPYVAKRLMNQD